MWSDYRCEWASAPADAYLAAEAGAFAALGCENVGVTGVGVAPAQVGVQARAWTVWLRWWELAIVNCRSGPKWALHGMTDARGLIEGFNAAWERGDLTAVSACLAEDVTYCPNAWDGPAGTVRGRDEVARAFADQLGPGPGPMLGPVWVAGNRVACEWRWAPAEDGTILRGLDVYLIRDGRIAAKDVYSKITAGDQAG